MGSVRCDDNHYPQVARMSITTKNLAIRIRHLSEDNKILSEIFMSPEDCYVLGNTLLGAYDEVMEID